MIKRRLGWAIYIAVVLILGALPYVAELPTPEDAIQVREASFTLEGGTALNVSLPHRWTVPEGHVGKGVYDIVFELESLPRKPLYLLIPILKKRLIIEQDDSIIYDSAVRRSWAGPQVLRAALPLLPNEKLRTGRNHLRLTLHGESVVPSYLSALYIGPMETLASHFKMRMFINERLKAMAYSAQILLGIGIFIAYLYRPKDRVFGWLAVLIGLSSVYGANIFAEALPAVMDFYPYVFILTSSVGCLIVIFILTLIGRHPPAILIIAAILMPIFSLALILGDVVTLHTLVQIFSFPVMAFGFLTAAAIAGWATYREKNIEAAFTLGPMLLFSWYMVHDLLMAQGSLPGMVYLAQDVRPLLMAAATIVLMRRLSVSLNDLDKTEEVLQARLTAKENELDAYFTKERERAEQTIVDAERRRLIGDLHDGMSGHLVSIIALSEKEDVVVKDIQGVARAALEDLRMVIYSLDIGGGDLPFALASYRERLVPVLRRLNIQTHWSMAALPGIDGASPGNVLIILRILQEATTNAQKHGAPSNISITGMPGLNGGARLIVENRGGISYVEAKSKSGGGYGVDNMRARAHSLGGSIHLEALTDGARLTLELPPVLAHPDP